MTEQITIITKITPSLLGDRRTLESFVGIDRLIVDKNKTAIAYGGDILTLYLADNFKYIRYKKVSESISPEVETKLENIFRGPQRPECTKCAIITKTYELIEDRAQEQYRR